MPLINCEESLTLTRSENCVITSRAYTEVVAGDNPVPEINNRTNAKFKIKDKNCMFQLLLFQHTMIINF